MSLLATGLQAQAPPGDTYFSLAITENSHNHTGAERLYLNFQEPPFEHASGVIGEIVSVRIAPGGVVMDGDDADWDPAFMTTVHALPQSNYPLSEFIDSVRTDLRVGSAWDATHVYFVVQWEDPGHNASTRYQKWIYGDQGGGELGWNKQVHIGATAGAPNAAAVNASGHVMAGKESEDRIFFMFPITDMEGNFSFDGPGCAMYCHTNLSTDYPWQNYTGEGVVAMHTNLVGDTADVWHWKSSRSEPSGFADDKYLDYGVGSDNGRMSDSGTSAYSGNDLVGGNPEWMHQSGLSYTGDVLLDTEAVPFSGTPVQGTEIPRNRSRASTGSRGDVQTAANYDPVTKRWTVEFKRLRDTGNIDDHSFESVDDPRAMFPLVSTVDTVAGNVEYDNNCVFCHLAEGVGQPVANSWQVPRVQRTSGSLIGKAIETVPSMFFLQNDVSLQDMEDIAAHLQTFASFEPDWTLTVNVVGVTDPGAVTSDPPGIDCANTCSAEFLNGTPILLMANAMPGFVFTGWTGGPCAGTGDCFFDITADMTVTATYEPDCNGNGIPDAQDISGSTSSDGNGNGIPDECECSSTQYCSTSPNSAGSGAVIGQTGSLSVSQNDAVLSVTGAPANKYGLFYYGSQALNTPFGDGIRCVGGNVFRLHPAGQTDGGGSISRPLDLTHSPANSGPGAITPGSRWYFQFWYRDPAAGGAGFNLSDALDLVFCI